MYRNIDADIARHAIFQVRSRRILGGENGPNYTRLDCSSAPHTGKRIAQDSDSQSATMVVKGTNVIVLTPMAYVCEQYISPKKKSRNSTGYNPASNSLNCLLVSLLLP